MKFIFTYSRINIKLLRFSWENAGHGRIHNSLDRKDFIHVFIPFPVEMDRLYIVDATEALIGRDELENIGAIDRFTFPFAIEEHLRARLRYLQREMV